jgi:predicted anti-sigma-YlaC factor YlaD
MKLWVWFAVAVQWLAIPQAMIHNGGLMVGVMAGKGISENVAFALSALLI